MPAFSSQKMYTATEKEQVRTVLKLLLQQPMLELPGSTGSWPAWASVWIFYQNSAVPVLRGAWHVGTDLIYFGRAATGEPVSLMTRVAVLATCMQVVGLQEDTELFDLLTVAFGRAIRNEMEQVFNSLFVSHTPPTQLAIHPHTFQAGLRFTDDTWRQPNGQPLEVGTEWLTFEL